MADNKPLCQKKTLPEAQRTQGLSVITWVSSPATKLANSVGKFKLKIGSNFGHQVPLHAFALVPNFATRLFALVTNLVTS